MTDTTIGIKLKLEGAQQVQSGAATAAGALTAVERATDKLHASATSAAGAMNLLSGVIGAAGAATAAKAFIAAADSVTVLNNQLKLATGSSAAAQQAYGALFDIAQRSRTSFTELGATFASISRATSELGISQGRLLTVTEAIGNAMAISGGSAQAMQAALTQLGQGFAAGTLRGEELNSVMEQTPRLARAIADGLGVSIGKLREMGQAGQLTAESVLGALESQAKVLSGEVKDSVVTVSQAMTQLGNAAVALAGQMDQASGATQQLSGFAQAAANDIGRLSDAMKRAQAIGASFLEQFGVAGAVAFGRGAFDLLNASASKLNQGINALTGGMAGLDERVRIMPLALQTTAEQALTLEGDLRLARQEWERLREQGEKEGKSLYLRSAMGDLEGYIARQQVALANIKRLQGESATEAAGGRGFVNPQTVGQRAAEEAEAMQKLNDLRGKALGANAGLTQSLINLDKAQRLGLISQAEQIKLAQGLVRETYKAKDAGDKQNAVLDAQRDAAKEYAGVIQDAIKIQQDAEGATLGWNKAQARLVEYLTSAAYQQHTDEMRSIVVQYLASASAAENSAAAAKAHAKAIEELDAKNAKYLQGLTSQADAAEREAQSLRDQIVEINFGKEARQALVQARLDDAAAQAQQIANTARLAGDTDAEVAAAQRLADQLRNVADARRALTKAETTKQVNDAAAKLAADAAADAEQAWQRTSDDIRSSLTDAFRRAFESGESFGSAFAQSIGNEIKARLSTAIAGALADGVMSMLGLTVANGLAGQYGSGGGGGGGGFNYLGAGRTGLSLYNSWDKISAGANNAYNWGAQAYATYTGNMAGSTSLYTGMANSQTLGAYGVTEAGATAGGVTGAGSGSAMSTLGPYILAAIAYAIGADQLEEWSLSFGARSLASRDGVANTTADQPGLQGIDADTLAGMRQAGMTIADPQALTDGLAAALFSFGDKFATSVGATSAISAAQVLLTSDRANPSWGEVKFLGAGGREIGSTGMQTDLSWRPEIAAPQLVSRSAGAFAQAMQETNAPDWVKQALSKIPAELERITPDIVKQFEDPLQQAQALANAAAGMFDGISNAYKALDQLDEQLGVLGGAFGRLSGMSSDARNALVSLFGGMEQFQTKIASYVDNFYSDGEKQALVLNQVGQALGSVGLKLPETRAGFRALVDAQDLTTEAGRKNFGVLMSVSDAFASVTEAGRSAADIASERAGLERRLLEVQGNTTALRKLERDALDESNRALFDQIVALEDVKKLLEEATIAARELAGFKEQFAALDFDIIPDELIAKVAELSGGFSTLTTNLSTYYDEFLTESERGTNSAQSLANALKAVGIEVPNTVAGLQELGRDGFRKLVDEATASGNGGAVAALLKVSGTFAELVPSAEQAAEAMQDVVDALKDAVSEAMQTLINTVNLAKKAAKDALDKQNAGFDARQTRARSTYDAEIARIEAERKRFGDNGTDALRDKIAAEQLAELYRRRKVQDDLIALNAKITEAAAAFEKAMSAVADKIKDKADEVSRLTSLSGLLRGTITALRPIGSEAFDRAQAQKQIRDALEQARTTGKLPKAEDLRNSLSIIQRPSDQLFATQADYLRDFNRTLNDVTELSEITDGQLDVAQQQLTALEAIRDLMEKSQFASGPEAQALRQSLTDALKGYGDLTGENLGDALDLFAGFEVGANQALIDKIEADDDVLSRASQRRIEDWNIELDKQQAELTNFLDGLDLRREAADNTLELALDGIEADRKQALKAYETEIARLDKIIEDNQKLVDEALGLNKTASSIDEAIKELKTKLAELAALKDLPKNMTDLAAAIEKLPAGLASAVSQALSGLSINVNVTGAGTTTGTTTSLPVPRITDTGTVTTPPPVLPGDGPATPVTPVTPVTGSYGPNGVWYPGGYDWAANDHTLTGTAGAVTDPSGLGDTLRQMLNNEQYALFRSTAVASQSANTLAKAAAVTGYFPSYLQSLVDQGLLESFAAGGMHTGGLRLVGEEGPELEVTGPARYYSADQTMAMLRDPHRANEALVAEVRQLRAQVAELQSAMVATAANTGKTARQLDRWDGEGLPTERT